MLGDPKSLPQGPWPGLQGIDHTKEELQNIEDILPKQKFTVFGYKQLSETACGLELVHFFLNKWIVTVVLFWQKYPKILLQFEF